MDDLNDLDIHLDFHNVDTDSIQVEETINAVFIIDRSPSISSYVSDLNAAFNDFIQTMQQSHISDRLLVSIVEFDSKVVVRSGFQPISGVPVIQFVPQGGGTALYDAVAIGIKNAVDYRDTLEQSGINVKTLIFCITDGEDNSSRLCGSSTIKKTLDDILTNEANAFSFTTILFGVGIDYSFTKAKNDMGFQHLAVVGNTGAEIKKMISFSSSISKSSSGANPVTTF